MSTARITSKGQITIPKDVRDRLGVQPGDSLEFRFEEGTVAVRPIRRQPLNEFRGLFSIAHAKDFATEREQAWKERARELTEHDA